MPTHNDLFHTLLFNPPGRYGLSTYGQTHAVILTGSPEFLSKGYALFVSFGGEAPREHEEESPLPPIHRAEDRIDGIWFCLPHKRIELALALYFYGQLYRHHTRDIIDAEGDFVEAVCDNEDALWVEAQQLACDFMVNHMLPDSAALPTYEHQHIAPEEHGVGHSGPAHTSDDSA